VVSYKASLCRCFALLAILFGGSLSATANVDLPELPGGGWLSHPRTLSESGAMIVSRSDSLLINGRSLLPGARILVNGQPMRSMADGRFADRIVWPEEDRIQFVIHGPGSKVATATWQLEQPIRSSSPENPVNCEELTAVMDDGAVISASKGGSYWLFPEAGSRFPVREGRGNWLKLDLGSGHEAWTSRSRVASLEKDEAAQEPTLLGSTGRASLNEAGDTVLRLPWRGSEPVLWQAEGSVDGEKLYLKLWNTQSHLDWIRLDEACGIRHVDWEPASDGSLWITLDLEAGAFCGHELSLDARSLLLRLKSRPQRLKDMVIVLDPGHGGSESGCVSAGGINEKDLVLDFARMLKAELESKGARVHLSRDQDQQLGLYERVDLADSLEADLLLSLHYDSVSERDDPWSKTGSSTFYWSAWSRNLAADLHHELLAGVRLNDQGLSWRSLAVIRQHQRPAVLLELGTLIHPAEEDLLVSRALQRKQARAIVKGIRAWLKRTS
jgi:N-acetylmuramoyl-L-alanine amidase